MGLPYILFVLKHSALWNCRTGPKAHSAVGITDLIQQNAENLHGDYRKIEDEGPFDGVLGFSQNASLALSYKIDHEINHPSQPALFSFGVFFCSNAVISPEMTFNADKLAKYARLYKGEIGGRPTGTIAKTSTRLVY